MFHPFGAFFLELMKEPVDVVANPDELQFERSEENC